MNRHKCSEDLFQVLADALMEVAAKVVNDTTELPDVEPECEGGVCRLSWKPQRQPA